MKRLVVALGGNALQKGNDPATAAAQLEVARSTANYLSSLVEKGYEIIISHGNGPQVGRLVLQNESASLITPAMPLDVCGSMSQGMIGYHLQQAMGDELRRRGMPRSIVTLITQVVVDKEDQGFKNPTKPIGPFYTMDEAKRLQREKGFVMQEDAGRGWRRVVASPEPIEIVEFSAIKALVDTGVMVIAAGGGGIPVVRQTDGSLEGVAAVIDKDYASEKLAEGVDADGLVILTAVEKVSIDFGKPEQRDLNVLTVKEAEKYIKKGHFAPGSMLPKVKAAITFVKSRKGRKAFISSLEKASEALEGKTGTTIK